MTGSDEVSIEKCKQIVKKGYLVERVNDKILGKIFFVLTPIEETFYCTFLPHNKIKIEGELYLVNTRKKREVTRILNLKKKVKYVSIKENGKVAKTYTVKTFLGILNKKEANKNE